MYPDIEFIHNDDIKWPDPVLGQGVEGVSSPDRATAYIQINAKAAIAREHALLLERVQLGKKGRALGA